MGTDSLLSTFAIVLNSDTATLSSASFLCLSSLGMEDQPSTRCLMELYDV